MKTISLIIFFLSYIPGYADYDFDLLCRTDTVQEVPPTGVGYFTFTLSNKGSEPDVYELNCLVTQTVPDWSIIYCLKGRCLEPGNPMYDTLQPGEADTTIEIKVYTSSTPGEAVALLNVRSLSDATLFKSIATRTSVAGGIQEGNSMVNNRLSGQNYYLIRRRRPLVFKGESGCLFDVSGKKTLILQAGANDLSFLNAGVYLINQKERRGKIVLF